MIARALAALGGRTLSSTDKAAGILQECQRAEFRGEGPTWEDAKAAAEVPADALVLYWLTYD